MRDRRASRTGRALVRWNMSSASAIQYSRSPQTSRAIARVSSADASMPYSPSTSAETPGVMAPYRLSAASLNVIGLYDTVRRQLEGKPMIGIRRKTMLLAFLTYALVLTGGGPADAQEANR